MLASKQSFSFPFMQPRWHHHGLPAAASLTAPRRCVVGLTKSVGAQLGMKVSKVRITSQRRSFFTLQIMAHYGRLLRASVCMEWMRSLISGVLAPLNFLQKPKVRTSTSMLCPWNTMAHWHSNHLHKSACLKCPIQSSREAALHYKRVRQVGLQPLI